MRDAETKDIEDIARKTIEIDRSIQETRIRMRPYTVGSGMLTVRKYGTCHVLARIAESCGLREDLRNAYGDYGDCILATAISHMQSSAYPTSVSEEMAENFSREILGIQDRFHPSMKDEVVEHIGSDADGRGDFFRSRVTRAGHIYSYDSYIVGENGNDDMGNSDLAMMFETDFDGVPVHFAIDTYESLRDMEIIDDMRIARELGAEACTYVFERPFPGNSERLERLIERGADFISVALPDTSCARAIVDRIGDGEVHERNGKRFLVYSERAGIVAKRIRSMKVPSDRTDDTERMEIVLEDDPKIHYTSKDSRIRMWAFRSDEEVSEPPERTEARIAVIERHLRKLDASEAIRQFESVAGRYAKYFNINLKNGQLELSVKRDELELLFNRDYIVYSRGFDTWEDLMDCLDGGRAFDDALSVMRGNLRMDGTDLMDNKEIGESMISFVALILWCELSNRLSRAGFTEPIPVVIRWLDTILAKGDGVRWTLIGQTPRTRRILTSLDAPLPKSIEMTSMNHGKRRSRMVKRYILDSRSNSFSNVLDGLHPMDSRRYF